MSNRIDRNQFKKMNLLTASRARGLVKPLDPSVIEDITNTVLVKILQEIAQLATGGNYQCTRDLRSSIEDHTEVLRYSECYSFDRVTTVYQTVLSEVLSKLKELGYSVTLVSKSDYYLISWEEATEIKGEKSEQRKA